MREFMLIPEVIFIYDRRLKDLHSVNMLSVLICTKGFSQISVMHTRFSATYVHL